MSVRLLALDLDGTLLDYSSNLLEENRLAVARALGAGLQAVVVTGRSWRGAKPFYETLGLTGSAICYLGALVVGDGAGTIVRCRTLEAEAWERLRQVAVNEGLAVTACVGADLAFATRRADDFISWDAWNPYTAIVADLSPVPGPPVLAAVYGEKAVDRVLAEFPTGLPGCQFDLSDRVAGEKVLHVWHAEVDKGRALAEFCRERGIAPEEVAALGDAPMDLPMLEFAGIGVAVPHAHPLLKAAADWVCTPAQAIDRILKG